MNEQKQEMVEQLQALSTSRMTRVYPRGGSLFRSGQVPKGVFYVQEGAVVLSKPSGTNKRAQQEEIGCGEIIGLTELFTGKRYQRNAICRSLAKVIFVSKEDFVQ